MSPVDSLSCWSQRGGCTGQPCDTEQHSAPAGYPIRLRLFSGAVQALYNETRTMLASSPASIPTCVLCLKWPISLWSGKLAAGRSLVIVTELPRRPLKQNAFPTPHCFLLFQTVPCTQGLPSFVSTDTAPRAEHSSSPSPPTLCCNVWATERHGIAHRTTKNGHVLGMVSLKSSEVSKSLSGRKASILFSFFRYFWNSSMLQGIGAAEADCLGSAVSYFGYIDLLN